MSFPSLVKTSDYDIYTKKYLQNLALEIQLNQNNFNKNVGYFKTGVQDTERTDSRSIEERAADVEKLKVQARVMLNKISDPTNTNEVLDYLVKNGEMLFFFIQQFPTFEKLVKEQFSGGIRAPLLISLIYKRFVSQQEDSLLPESAEFDIISKVMTSDDVDVLLGETKNDLLKEELRNVKSQLPPQSEVKRITDDPVRYKDELKYVADLLKNSPNVDDYNKLIEEYNDASLKDELNNYDLENAEQDMIDKLNSFILETANFRNNPANIEKIEKINKETKTRTDLTRSIPKAIDTRIKQKSEAERNREKSLRSIRQGRPLKSSSIQQRRLSPQEELQSSIKLGRPLKSTTTTITQPVLSLSPQEQVQSDILKKRTKAPNRSPELIAAEKAEKEARRLKRLEKTQATLENRLLGVQLPTPVVSVPQKTTEKVATIGSGLLNKQEQHAHRFKVLKGEILAGNTSRQVIKEMRSLVKTLMSSQELSIDQGNNIIKELKTL